MRGECCLGAVTANPLAQLEGAEEEVVVDQEEEGAEASGQHI